MENTDKKIDRRIQRTRRLLQQAMIDLIVEKGYETWLVRMLVWHRGG